MTDSHDSDEIERMEENHDALEGIKERPPKKKVTFRPALSKYFAEAKAAIEESAYKITGHEAMVMIWITCYRHVAWQEEVIPSHRPGGKFIVD